jgi:hypothetical protein
MPKPVLFSRKFPFFFKKNVYKIFIIFKVDSLLTDTAEIEQMLLKRPAGTRQTQGRKHGMVWESRKKISQINNNYLYLLFSLLFILSLVPNGISSYRYLVLYNK